MGEVGSTDLVGILEACEILGLHRNTIYRMLKRGQLVGIRIGQRWRFRRDELERVLAQSAPLIVSPDRRWQEQYAAASLGLNDPLPVALLLSVPAAAFAESPEDPPAFWTEHVEIARVSAEAEEACYRVALLEGKDQRSVVGETQSLFTARRMACDALWYRAVDRPTNFDEGYIRDLYGASMDMYRTQLDLDVRSWRQGLVDGGG